MSPRALLLALSLLGCAAPLASAQGIAVWKSGDKDLQSIRVPDGPSEAEARYFDELRLRLGKGREATAIRVPYGATDLAAGGGRLNPRSPVRDLAARGITASVGGVEVTRLRFPSADHAQRFALYGAKTLDSPTLVEVRGRQVVVARGDRLVKPKELEKVRAAAWSVLPHAPGAPSMSGVTLSRSNFAFESRVPNEDLDTFTKGALDEARKSPAPNSLQKEGKAIQIWEGHTSSAEALERGSRVWASGSHAGIDTDPPIRALAESLSRGSDALANPGQKKKVDPSTEGVIGSRPLLPPASAGPSTPLPTPAKQKSKGITGALGKAPR
jgi:hypothetical protein